VNETIESVVWISDLRNFTRMSDEFAPPVMLGILNDHFERVVGAIADQGGEVLKFMSDSVLAIFPVDSELGPQAAVTVALAAARDATKRTGEGNAARKEKGLTEIGCGIALHHGNVVYGNIGGTDRLDLTVIGPAVNQTARIEALCRTLNRPPLVSQRIADAAESELVSLSLQALRGVREPHEIFTLPEYA
jgi:adenylate cyclase